MVDFYDFNPLFGRLFVSIIGDNLWVFGLITLKEASILERERERSIVRIGIVP